jgi:PTH2 family peptidyl-tRNA hydrolase
MTHKQVIVMRKDLNMRRGKQISQGAHASLAVILDLLKTEQGLEDPRAKPWLEGKFKKVCVYVNSEKELLELYGKAKQSGILGSLITDSGLTEFHGVQTITCIAIGPDTEERVNSITGDLPLL